MHKGQSRISRVLPAEKPAAVYCEKSADCFSMNAWPADRLESNMLSSAKTSRKTVFEHALQMQVACLIVPVFKAVKHQQSNHFVTRHGVLLHSSS